MPRKSSTGRKEFRVSLSQSQDCARTVSLVFDPSRYLSGEDPFLGYHLAQPAVAGIQSNRVIANAKHFVNNNQETNRNTVLEIVDERTRYEMYYPPFEGAANAGVGSVMCSCRCHVTVLCLAIVRPKLDSLNKYFCERRCRQQGTTRPTSFSCMVLREPRNSRRAQALAEFFRLGDVRLGCDTLNLARSRIGSRNAWSFVYGPRQDYSTTAQGYNHAGSN